jgi:hypothetical protein
MCSDWHSMQQNWCWIMCLLNSNFVRSASPDRSLN